MEEQKAAAATVESNEQSHVSEYKNISFNYGVNGASMNIGFTYSDSFLLRDNNEMWPELAKVSIGLAAAAYVDILSSPASLIEALGEGENGMGYTVDSSIGNWNREHTLSDNDFVRYVIATKEIEVDGKNYIIYCVPIQGTRGSYDWNSDFKIGDGENHEGFYLAHEEVMDNLTAAIASHSDEYGPDNTIVWLMGHSRGAAVANIVAGELTTSYGNLVSAGRVFAYTFACPAVSKSEEVRSSGCENIFNFNSPDDFVPTVPLTDWNYVRYGIDQPGFETTVSQNFLNRFQHEQGEAYVGSQNNTDYLTEILNIWVTNPQKANSPECQAIFSVVAYAMQDKFKNQSAYQNLIGALSSAGYTLGEHAEEVVWQYFTKSIGADELISWFERVDALAVRANSCLLDTIGMSDEDFSAWIELEENRNRIEILENETGYNISTRSDLEALYGLLVADTIGQSVGFKFDATTAENLLQTLIEIVMYFTTGSNLRGIGQAHMSETYFLAISSMYYGYKGWFGYNGNFGAWLKAEDKVETVGERCFTDSTIAALRTDGQVKYIGPRACEGASSLGQVLLVDGLEKIGSAAFRSCTSLAEIEIPNSVTVIEDNAFNGCTGLTSVTIPAGIGFNSDNNNINAFKDCKGIKTVHLTGSGPMADHDRYYYDYSITSMIYDYKGYEISTDSRYAYYTYAPWGRSSWAGNSVTVNIDEGITSISDGAFWTCRNLVSVTIPESVTEIGEYAFYYCDKSFMINIPSRITKIGSNAFTNHKWPSSPVIPDGCMSIGASAFTKITVPIQVYPYSCGLQYVKENSISYSILAYNTMILPDMLSEINEEAFAETAAEAVILPENITNINALAFADSHVRVLVFSNSDVTIAANAVSGCEDHIRFACDPESAVGLWATEHGIAVTSCMDAA